MPAPHCSDFFTGRMTFLLPNQQRQSTEGNQDIMTCSTNYSFLSCASKNNDLFDKLIFSEESTTILPVK